MKIVLALALAASLAACNSYSTRDRALVGGAVGAGSGALIAGAAAGTGGAALAGGIIGGAAGAILGGATTPKACRDAYGRAVRCP
ncbi:bacteriocin [Amorphus orientalis]|uniref:Surface antigen n=1 Tax=Amorphus orientalis TaxID=649198 RepID=A0AAE3VPA9_9HYPH|nr:bacteriocin [Amorphus orientalis]MDQ0316314.1 surface antigen [Amorphus orientalis]